MTCQEFGLIARDYARSEWLSAAEHERASNHVAGCAACRQRVTNEITLTAALGRVRQRQESTTAPPTVEAALMSSFAARHRKREPTWKHLYWALPAAAMLLLALALTRPVSDPKPAAVVRLAPPQVETAVSQPVVEPEPVIAARPKLKPRAMRVGSASAARVTEFIPLRFGKPVESGEQIQVVRIQMRRSELMRLGLPVAPDAASAFIQADVLLGEDGLAKAIRFVY